MSEKCTFKLEKGNKLPLTSLDSEEFEQFFTSFLSAGLDLTIVRDGHDVTRKVVNPQRYGISGHKQKGIDIVADAVGDGVKEEWVFQCKHHKSWDKPKTTEAIGKANAEYPSADHYFLVLSIDPSGKVIDLVRNTPNWTLITQSDVSEILKTRKRISLAQARSVISIFNLPESEIKRIIGSSNRNLISPDEFFDLQNAHHKSFHHNHSLVGRKKNLQNIIHHLEDTSFVILLLVASGGMGKSRLLKELPRKIKDKDILFVNRHSQDDLIEAMESIDRPTVVVIDDAHRHDKQFERVCHLASKSTFIQILASTRPQSFEKLKKVLIDLHLNEAVKEETLSALSRAEIKELITQISPNLQNDFLRHFVEKTKQSPFIATLASELINEGKFKTSTLLDSDEFRRAVLNEFENKNLALLSEKKKEDAKRVLRLIAFLSPIEWNLDNLHRISKLLEIKPFDLEDIIQELRLTDLLSGKNEPLRVYPDLFSDFLVYETCFEPQKKNTSFIQCLIDTFPEYSLQMIQNLSESAWVAQENNQDISQITKRLIENIHKHFKESSFIHRKLLLNDWKKFAIFQPVETLKLANLAIEEKESTANPEDEDPSYAILRDTNNYSSVIKAVPDLITEIAVYEEEHRSGVLEILWKLGLEQPIMDPSGMHVSDSHPWHYIGKLTKITHGRNLEVALETLRWIQRKFSTKKNLELIAERKLSPSHFLSACFKTEFTYTTTEGRVVTWHGGIIDIDQTIKVRELALDVTFQLIEGEYSRTHLYALDVLSNAIRPLSHPMEGSKKFSATLVTKWNRERIKVLDIYEKILKKQPAVGVRYSIRQTLLQRLAWETPSRFQEKCDALYQKVSDFPDLTACRILFTGGDLDYEEEYRTLKRSDRIRKSKENWESEFVNLTSELLQANPDADALFSYLHSLANKPSLEKQSVNPYHLYKFLCEKYPKIACGLGELIIHSTLYSPLFTHWPLLVSNNEEVGDAQFFELCKKAFLSEHIDLSIELIRHIFHRSCERKLSDEFIDLLKNRAKSASAELTYYYLRSLASVVSEENAWQIDALESLPLEEHIHDKYVSKALIDQLSLYAKKSSFSEKIISCILSRLVTLEFKIEDYDGSWSHLFNGFPDELFQFFYARLKYAEHNEVTDKFKTLPSIRFFHPDVSLLKQHPDYKKWVADVWKNAIGKETQRKKEWKNLLQLITRDDFSEFIPELIKEIQTAESEARLVTLSDIVLFEGSLVIFRFPELTEAILRRAEELGGNSLKGKLEFRLTFYSRPHSYETTKGVLDKDCDYVEAEAVRAANANKKNSLLYRFYSNIVKEEVDRRKRDKALSEAELF